MRLLTLVATVALLAGMAPVAAVPDPTGLLTSPNVELVTTMPDATAAISIAFSSDSPHMYVSTLQGLHIYDISNPLAPVPTGVLPMAIYQNEAMSLGERPETGEKFVIMASTQAMLTLRGDRDTSGRFFVVVDVTDPAAPEIVSSLQTTTRTHTVSCDSSRCDYAYTDGRSQGAISIVDLRDFREPAMVDTFRSVVTLGHDQDLDDAGILWHVGGQGTVALDISNPTEPVQIASTSRDGVEGQGWNKFIHHNSLRPNALAFEQERGGDGRLSSGPPALERGNVLLVTEEEVGAGVCDDGSEGSFQTWYIPYLDEGEYLADNPDLAPGGGRMTPLDRWNTELLGSGEKAEYGTRCSAHYFDHHQDGFIAQGWYGQGLRILDVRDPLDIKQVGYALQGTSMVWGGYWVPEYGEDGVQTGQRTEIVYTADNVRGVDVYRVTLPETEPEATTDLRAPILPEWLAPGAGAAASYRPDPDYGWACLLPGA